MQLLENEPHYSRIELDGDNYIEKYSCVKELVVDTTGFNKLWNDHPVEFHEVVIHGKRIKTPRWQQAFGKNYQYTGSKNNALPISDIHLKYLSWCKENIDDRLNGLLVNWYDGSKNHYIGKHRDSTIGLIKSTPIVTVSLGQERIFRFRPYSGKGFIDFKVNHGDVFVIPWVTNQNYTHEIPKFAKYKNRRISITLRAYE